MIREPHRAVRRGDRPLPGVRAVAMAGDAARVRRMVVGVLAVALAVGLLIAPFAGHAHGQEEEGEEGELATITQLAYWTYSTSTAVPPSLTSEFPPAVVCVLRPEFCREELEPVTGPVGGLIGDAPAVPDAEVEQAAHEHQPREGDVPVAMQAGTDRYVSAVRFELPEIPAGALVTRFELVLHEGQPTFAMESEVFRDFMFATALQFRESSRDPTAYQRLAEKMAEEGGDYLAGAEPTGVQACPILDPWEPGPSKNPEAEGDDAEPRPETDCILGATGMRDAEARLWRFDLSFAAQAWVEGELHNLGLLLFPTAAPNIAIGDPDTSSNWQITFFGPDIEATAPRLIVEWEDFDDFDDFGDFDDDPWTAPPPSGGTSSTPTDTWDAPADAPSDEGLDQTDVADTPPEAAVPVDLPQEEWWAYWLLAFPLGAAGLYYFVQAATATPAGMGARAQEGAMSRLVERRNGAHGPTQL